MINAPMTCLTFNRLQSLMIGHETSIQPKIMLQDLCFSNKVISSLIKCIMLTQLIKLNICIVQTKHVLTV